MARILSQNGCDDMRNYTLIDQLCLKADTLLRTLTGQMLPENNLRETPAKDMAEPELSQTEKKHVAGLMRINYAGEVCAQALYQGQALTTKNLQLKQTLTQAGLEEQDHLYWCQHRIQDLNNHVSLLNPLWYGGSFILGMIAGRCGDQWNLGFLAETEHQVTEHLNDHLTKLPQQDDKTKAVLMKMRDEEAQHAAVAEQEGAAPLPSVIQTAMRFTAKIMTKTAYWV